MNLSARLERGVNDGLPTRYAGVFFVARDVDGIFEARGRIVLGMSRRLSVSLLVGTRLSNRPAGDSLPRATWREELGGEQRHSPWRP